MSDVTKVVFQPEAGETVELPENVGRIDVDRIGSPKLGYGRIKIGVLGHGDLEKYVVLETHADKADIEEGAQVLAVDVAKDRLIYAVSIEAFGGDADVRR
jgi:hypothetical protein